MDTLQKVNASWLPPRVTVMGLARSGIAAARFLLDRGCKVFVSDTASAQKIAAILLENGLESCAWEAGGHSDSVLESGLIILSPGIRADIPVLQCARQRSIPVLSEIELAYRFTSAPVVAVTGSTGKSTTVSLLGAICSAAGKDHVVAGNIGLPLISAAPGVSARGIVVAEVSSFQLETIDLFKPKAAAILNLMKNHLDRYESEEAYYDAKKAIARNMGDSDILVLNANDPRLMAWAAEMVGKVSIVYTGKNPGQNHGVWCDERGMIVYGTEKAKKLLLAADRLFIKGMHNIENACVASALALESGIEPEAIANGLQNFKGLEHRLEFVKTVRGVLFYNDSKATTAESICCALAAFSAPVHLIAGGRDKGCDFDSVKQMVADKVKRVAVIGEAADRIRKAWHGASEIVEAATLNDAVTNLFSEAVPGDCIILSPGCSSFDMFSSFEERGNSFKKIVQNLLP